MAGFKRITNLAIAVLAVLFGVSKKMMKMSRAKALISTKATSKKFGMKLDIKKGSQVF